MSPPPPPTGPSRRRFLKATGWVAAGVTVVYLVGRRYVPVLPSSSSPGPDDGVAWLQVRGDGRIAMLSPAHELGQGSSTGLAQIAAEELNVAVDDVAVSFPSTRDVSRMRFTTGSQAIALHARPVARAAAALREDLRRRAAGLIGVEPASLTDAPGGFAAADGRTLAYADIVRGEPVVLDAGKLPEARLYTFDAVRPHRLIGRAAPLVQARDVVTGRPVFTADLRLPDMVYGRAVQSPVAGARITAVDVGRARAVPGVVEVVVDRARHFVGVVAATPSAVGRALAEVKVTWDRPTAFTATDIDRLIDVDRALGAGRLEHRIVDDDLAAAVAWGVDLRVDLPILHHAAQEPRSAVVRFGERDGVEVVDIWTGSQDVFVNQKKAAAELGWSVDRVAVHAMRVGGAFGGRALYDVVRDALLLGLAVRRPIKVEWSRADEFVADRTRPPSSHRVRIGADARGRITDWWHAAVSGHVLLTEILAPPWLLPPLRLAIADFGATRGIEAPYAATRRRIELSDVELPIHVGQWRSLGATPNNIAIEMAIDELALRLGHDPVALRLANLAPDKARLSACLAKVRELCEARPRPPQAGFGRGYAAGIYHDHSYVAVAFDVAVDRAAGEVRVVRACCAQDTGLAVNPDQISAQIEGCIMMAIGQVLMEAAPIGRGGIAARRFGDYPTPTLGHTPEIEIAILSDPAVAPAGVGETALVAAVPALANAIRDATGYRPTRLPIRQADLRRPAP